MKKILLLLFISFTFIGSANANSIEEAFGYKLGQVVEDVRTIVDVMLASTSTPIIVVSSGKEFIPKKPLPGKHQYKIQTTLKDKKIYQISVILSERKSYDNLNDCISDRGYYFKMVSIYESNYGEFKKYPEVSWKAFPNDEEKRSYTKGNREIEINCSRSDNGYSFSIYYIDSKLEEIVNIEVEEVKKKEIEKIKQKILDESQDYDI